MIEGRDQALFGRMAPERARAVYDAHPLRWPVLERYPVAIAVLTVVALMVALQIEGLFAPTTYYQVSIYGSLLRAVLCLLLIWAVARAGLLRAIGLTSVPVWRAVWLFWLPMLLVLAGLLGQFGTDSVTDDGAWLGLQAPYVFFVGLLEELVTRGVVLFLLLYAWRDRKYGVVGAVLASSALFGLAHLANSLFGGGAPWSQTLTQVLYATLIGVGLSGLVLRTNTLWFAAVWHAAFDYNSLALPGPGANRMDDLTTEDIAGIESTLGAVAPFLPLALYGLYLVRRRTSVIPTGLDTGGVAQRA